MLYYKGFVWAKQCQSTQDAPYDLVQRPGTESVAGT